MAELASRLACADSSFPRLSHETALAVICDLGLPAVDVCVFPAYAHTSPAALRTDPTAVTDAVRARLEHAGLAVADVFLILGFDELAVNHPDADVRREALAHFEGAVAFARALGAPGMTVLPGMEFDGVESDVSLRLAADELQRRAQVAGEAGLALSIEPHVGSIVETPPRTQQLLALAPHVSLALDYSHFIYQGLTQAEVDALIPAARHVHLRQAEEGAMQVPTRAGRIDFGLLRSTLDAAGYEGYLTLEYQWEEWLDCNRVDCISETAELRDWILG